MSEKTFYYIDKIYDIILEYNFDYQKSKTELIDLKEKIEKESLIKDAYYYQLMGTIEYFIYRSHALNAPYESLLIKNNKIEEYFKNSLKLDSDNPPLRYLYSLYLYCTGDFKNSKIELQNINTQYYIDFDVVDQVLRIKELILCCNIFLGVISNENDIIYFVLETKAIEQDFYPSELIETLLYKNQLTLKSKIDNILKEF